MIEDSENTAVVAKSMKRMFQFLEENICAGIEAGGRIDVTKLRQQILWTIRRAFAA